MLRIGGSRERYSVTAGGVIRDIILERPRDPKGFDLIVGGDGAEELLARLAIATLNQSHNKRTIERMSSSQSAKSGYGLPIGR
jgi:hypothetical protein